MKQVYFENFSGVSGKLDIGEFGDGRRNCIPLYAWERSIMHIYEVREVLLCT